MHVTRHTGVKYRVFKEYAMKYSTEYRSKYSKEYSGDLSKKYCTANITKYSIEFGTV